jgi:hypothetical protein
VADPSVASSRRTMDRLGTHVLAHEFLTCARRNVGLLGTDLRLGRSNDHRGVSVFRADLEIASIHPTMAHVRGGRGVSGNFLTDGQHWEETRRAIEQRDAERASGSGPAGAARAIVTAGRTDWRELVVDPPASSSPPC